MIKKLSVAFIVIVVLLSFFTMNALAAQSGDYVYEVSNDKAPITWYYGNGGAVTIPSNLGGYPVTGIGEFAFEGCD